MTTAWDKNIVLEYDHVSSRTDFWIAIGSEFVGDEIKPLMEEAKKLLKFHLTKILII